MKTRDIVRTQGIDSAAFDSWLRQSGYRFKLGPLGGLDIDDDQNIDEIISSFKRHQNEQHLAAAWAAAEQQRAALERQPALASMLITSGFSFDGYTITKYSGYISGDDAVQISRGTQGFFSGNVTDVAASLMESLVQIRRNALAELKEAAYALGCNAVIGVDFDYLTLDPETATASGGTLYLPYVFGVTANGNAVVIEKNERTGLL